MKVTQLEQEKIQLKECNDKVLEDVKAAHTRLKDQLDTVTAQKCQEIEEIQQEYKKEKSVSNVINTLIKLKEISN